MEDLIVLVLQGIFEFIVEVLCYVPFDWPRTRDTTSLTETCFALFALGALLAGVSVVFFRHTFLALPALRIANLMLAPIASAYLSQALARRRARRGADSVPRDRFWQAFWFTTGLVAVRFVLATRD
jgi:hypothetical protein